MNKSTLWRPLVEITFKLAPNFLPHKWHGIHLLHFTWKISFPVHYDKIDYNIPFSSRQMTELSNYPSTPVTPIATKQGHIVNQCGDNDSQDISPFQLCQN